jgi:hypothetical protein
VDSYGPPPLASRGTSPSKFQSFCSYKGSNAMARRAKSIFRHVVKCRTCAPQTPRGGFNPCRRYAPCYQCFASAHGTPPKRFGACSVGASADQNGGPWRLFLAAPLLVASGSGSVSRQVLGTVVIGLEDANQLRSERSPHSPRPRRPTEQSKPIRHRRSFSQRCCS